MDETVVALAPEVGRALARAGPAPVRRTPLPRFLQIEPVGQCNLRCRMCPIELRPESARGHPAAHMDYGTFTRLLDQFPGIEQLQLQGLGEPMLHPRFFDMVAHAAARGIQVTTNTNLTLLTDARAEACVTSGLHTAHLSIDGATAATYEHIRQRARFPKVMRNLRRLVDAKRRLGSATPHLRWVMVVMRENLHELAGAVRLAAEHGIPEVHVQHLCHDFQEASLPERYRPMREFVDAQTLLGDDPARVRRHFEDARRAADDAGLVLRLPEIRFPDDSAAIDAPVEPGRGRARCDWPWSGGYVSWDGRAMPCCMVSTPDRLHFGNMARDGVAAVWNAPAFEAFRERLDAADPPPEICGRCSVWRGVF